MSSNKELRDKLEWDRIKDTLERKKEDGSDDLLKSPSSAYSLKEVIDRIYDSVNEIYDKGEITDQARRLIPRIETDEGNLRELVPKVIKPPEWRDMLTEDEGYREGSSFEKYIVGKNNPYQGWKIHVSADPLEAKKVLEATQDFLLNIGGTGVSHKFVKDVETLEKMEEGYQKGKFLTIYPPIDQDKNYVMNEKRTQAFQKGNEKFNKNSINCNVKNTNKLVNHLINTLENSEAGLYGGPKITSRYNEENQVHHKRKGTRIHYRYGKIASNAEIENRGEINKVSSGLIGLKGEIVGNSYDSENVEGKIDPKGVSQS